MRKALAALVLGVAVMTVAGTTVAPKPAKLPPRSEAVSAVLGPLNAMHRAQERGQEEPFLYWLDVWERMHSAQQAFVSVQDFARCMPTVAESHTFDDTEGARRVRKVDTALIPGTTDQRVKSRRMQVRFKTESGIRTNEERAFLDGKDWKFALSSDIFAACNAALGRPPQ